jgi:hypothetical protein
MLPLLQFSSYCRNPDGEVTVPSSAKQGFHASWLSELPRTNRREACWWQLKIQGQA